jgi:hypothetical protein
MKRVIARQHAASTNRKCRNAVADWSKMRTMPRTRRLGEAKIIIIVDEKSKEENDGKRGTGNKSKEQL